MVGFSISRRVYGGQGLEDLGFQAFRREGLVQEFDGVAGKRQEAVLEFGASSNVKRGKQDREFGPGTVEAVAELNGKSATV